MKPQSPALLGGTPTRPDGPPVWPESDPEVNAALEQAYREGTWGRYHGPAVPRLETALKEYHNVSDVLLCGSGTFAVELALRSFQVNAGDEVLLSAYDYPGNFFAVHALGAMPVLVDIDPLSWQMDLDSLRAAIGPRCKAIIASHLHGGLVPIRQVMEIARSSGLKAVEDAAQCPGALINGRKAGTWGDVGVLSFGGSKLLTAGRGGALLFQDPTACQRARTYQLRGNLVCPLSELQAAVLMPQLQKLDARNAQRRDCVAQLRVALAAFPGVRLLEMGRGELESQAAYYKVGVQYDAHTFGLPRNLLVKAMRAEGIPLDEGFAALHVGRSARRYRAEGPLTEAERAHRQGLVLHHPILLGNEAVGQISQALSKIHAWREELLASESASFSRQTTT